MLGLGLGHNILRRDVIACNTYVTVYAAAATAYESDSTAYNIPIISCVPIPMYHIVAAAHKWSFEPTTTILKSRRITFWNRFYE